MIDKPKSPIIGKKTFSRADNELNHLDEIEPVESLNAELEDSDTEANISPALAESPEYSAGLEDNYDYASKKYPKGNFEETVSNFSNHISSPCIFPHLKPQALLPLEKGHTRVISIGGNNEVGKNMLMYEYANEIVIIDAGIQFPENDMLGAKYSLPDVSFLIPSKDLIRGILITHGHLDHIGGLKHLLPALGFPPIYGTKLTLGLIKRQLEDVGILDKTQLRVVNPDVDGIFQIGAHFKAEFFRENHNIPDACGIYLETPTMRMVHTGDFKFDFTPSIDQPANLSKIGEIGSRGIDLLMSDSTNSLKEGFTQTEADIGEQLHKIISEAQGRVIIATFSSLIGRIQQIVDSSEKMGRTLFLNGRSMVENVAIGRELGFVRSNPGTIRRLTNKIEGVPDSKQIVLTTGSQGEEFSGLYRMAYGEHPIVKIKPGDTIVLSSTPIPGNERGVVNLMNELIRLGATLYTKEGMDIHTSGHASREEQKIMINLIRPKHFMPIHGELFMRVAHKKTAMSLGVPEKNVFLMDNGSMLNVDEKRSIQKIKYKLKLEEIIVDGHGIGIANSHVIEARAQMMKAGVVVVVFQADAKTKEIL